MGGTVLGDRAAYGRIGLTGRNRHGQPRDLGTLRGGLEQIFPKYTDDAASELNDLACTSHGSIPPRMRRAQAIRAYAIRDVWLFCAGTGHLAMMLRGKMVEPIGIEPTTSSLRTTRSPN